MSWIKCSVRMPNRLFHETVLVCDDEGSITMADISEYGTIEGYLYPASLRDGFNEQENIAYSELIGRDCVYWMPLPDPPCTESVPVANPKADPAAVVGGSASSDLLGADVGSEGKP
jgi:hypothetical protein